jgi:hypothetical protein
LGGPILKNRLFFFLDYEGFRQVLKPLNVLTVPTQNELNGILVVPVKDPLTGTVYPAGQPIPAGVINPISQQIIGFFKEIQGLPLSGLPTTSLAQNDYATLVPFTDNSDKADLRLDWQIGEKDSSFIRISDRKETGVNYPALPLPLDGQTNGTSASSTSRSPWAIRTYLMPPRSSTPVLDFRVPRPAYIRFRSATARLRFLVCRRSRRILWWPADCPPLALPDLPLLACRAPTRSGRIRHCSIPR